MNASMKMTGERPRTSRLGGTLPPGDPPGLVWLVEDSPAQAQLAIAALAPAFVVEHFLEGAALLERLASGSRPDVIVLDWQLPGISGIEVLRFLRTTFDESVLPVLVLTVRGAKADLAAGLEAGANDYVGKPFDEIELRARVRSLVRIRRLAERLRRTEEARSSDNERQEAERDESLRREREARAEADAARAQLHDVFMQAPIPVVVLEGPQHVFRLANPDYQRILGSPRPLVGKPVREAVPELARQGYFELLDEVYATGRPFVGRAVPVELDRNGDGVYETAYFNFVYAAYRGADGRVAGITACASEVTEQVQARERAEALAERLRQSEELFRVAQEVSPIAFSYYGLVRDESGDVIDLEMIYQNDAAAHINRLPSGHAAAGIRMLDAFPGLRESGLWAHYHHVATTGASFSDEVYYGGEHFDAWFRVVATRPTAETVSLTFEDVTARRRVEQAQQEATERVVDVLESMGDAFFALDADWRITLVNRKQEQISHTRREETIGQSFWDVFPAARDPASKYWNEYRRCVAEQVPVHFEEQYEPLGIWTEVDAFPASRGGLSVFFRDITARKTLEAEREQLYEIAKAGETQLRTLADTLPTLAWQAEPDGSVTWYNRRWHEYTGLSSAELEGWKWHVVFEPADLDRVTAKWRAALASGQPWEDTFRLRRHDGAFRWFLARALPVRDEQGRIVRWFGTNVDIDEQKRATDTLSFLADASAVLGSTLDIGRTVQDVTGLVVPARADSCCVYLEREAGQIELAAVSHVDPAKAELLRELDRRYPFRREDAVGPGQVLATGRTALLPEVDDEVRRSVARDSTHLAMLRELVASSAIVVPLSVHGRAFGALSFAMAGSGRRLEAADVSWAEELGRRVAIAVDNAHLFEATQRERRRVEEANRVKDEFLSVASHELRTPLNAILGWSRMLRTGSLSEEKRGRALETIERNARVQVQLVDDILDVSRIFTGKLRLSLAPVDPTKVLEAAVEVVRPAADAKGVRLQVLLDPDAGIVHGDADRIQQVVWNLLANAIKFTPKGGRVYLRMQREGSSVEIVVSDTGSGIDASFLPYVFQPFRQQDASITRTHGGLGLGLAIGKHLVELHGGRIEAHSDGEGKGATFTVRLPISPVRSTAVAPPSDAPAAAVKLGLPLECPPELTGLDVLVVDDEPDARELIASILEECKATVRTVGSAREVLDLFRDRPPDVLVSDIGMPDESGYELIRKIRRLPADRGGRVPAVALTAYAAVKDRTRALMEGFTAHAAKPTDPQELVAVIVALLGRHPKR